MKEKQMNEVLFEKARKLRNQRAKEWRHNNPDKVKAINLRYWVNQAEKLEKQKGGEM